MKCSGECMEHVGKVERVRLIRRSDKSDFGIYWLCQKAQNNFLINGFMVESLKKKKED